VSTGNQEIARMLAKRARKENHAARRALFEQTYVPLRPKLVRYAMRRTKCWYDAEDIAQDTLLRLMKWHDEKNDMVIRDPAGFALFVLKDSYHALVQSRTIRRKNGEMEPRFSKLSVLDNEQSNSTTGRTIC
jgi:DNA-directed RNA polymerase specialized sigma24 family protein